MCSWCKCLNVASIPSVRLNKFSGATFLNHSNLVFHDGCFDRIRVLSRSIRTGLFAEETAYLKYFIELLASHTCFSDRDDRIKRTYSVRPFVSMAKR